VAENDKLHYEQDYPLSEKRRDLVTTSKGRSIDDVTLEAVMDGEVEADEIRVTPEILEYQAQIAESIGRPQLAANMRRAAELTAIPDDRILEIYNALRPDRSTKDELLEIADELENEYDAQINAALVREAADVYETRGRLREPEEEENEGE
jgi:propanediol dehydratase small subunit